MQFNENQLEILNFDFEKPASEKPWLNQANDLSDYFNYGFNEETWRVYATQLKCLEGKSSSQNTFSKSSLFLETGRAVDLGGFGQFANDWFLSYELFDSLKNRQLNFLLQLRLRKSSIKDRLEQFLSKNIDDKL